MKFNVWYMRPEWFREGICYAKPDPANLGKTHVFLTSVEIDEKFGDRALENLFHRMQGEVWSPNGEARALIRSKGLEHTSMSVGDVAVDEDGGVHLVASFGFEKIGRREVVS